VLGMVREAAARILRLPDYGLYEGARAELVVLDAESAVDALRFLPSRRWTIHEGRVVAETRQEAELNRAQAGSAAPAGE
jgi:cytosine deaminase